MRSGAFVFSIIVLLAMTNTPDFVYVATLPSIHDLMMATPLLNDAGITYYTKNENLISINPLFSNATGGIDIMVKTDEAEVAHTILKQHGYIIDEEASNANAQLAIEEEVKESHEPELTLADTPVKEKKVPAIIYNLFVLIILVIVALVIYQTIME